jgi:hypothetical protein
MRGEPEEDKPMTNTDCITSAALPFASVEGGATSVSLYCSRLTGEVRLVPATMSLPASYSSSSNATVQVKPRCECEIRCEINTVNQATGEDHENVLL